MADLNLTPEDVEAALLEKYGKLFRNPKIMWYYCSDRNEDGKTPLWQISITEGSG